jgi:hypothetical protein
MKYLFLLFFSGLIGCSTAQLPIDKEKQPISIEASFPETWAGIYRGQLEIYTATGVQQSVAMELEVAPTDSVDRWIWAITYGPDSIAGRRSYELVVVDPAKGHYQIDEKNSIVLDSFLKGDFFVSRFSVMGNLLDCTYEKVGDEIFFTIIMGNEAAVSDIGDGTMKGDTIPEVQAYPIGVVQRGRLKRIF